MSSLLTPFIDGLQRVLVLTGSKPLPSPAVATLNKDDWMTLDASLMRTVRAKLRGLFELSDNQVLCSDFITPME